MQRKQERNLHDKIQACVISKVDLLICVVIKPSTLRSLSTCLQQETKQSNNKHTDKIMKQRITEVSSIGRVKRMGFFKLVILRSVPFSYSKNSKNTDSYIQKQPE